MSFEPNSLDTTGSVGSFVIQKCDPDCVFNGTEKAESLMTICGSLDPFMLQSEISCTKQTAFRDLLIGLAVKNPEGESPRITPEVVRSALIEYVKKCTGICHTGAAALKVEPENDINRKSNNNGFMENVA